MIQPFSFIGVDPLVITPDNKIVLALRGDDAGAELGKWHIPGALVKADETIESAVIRAVKEKTNLDVRLFGGSLQDAFVGMYDALDREPRYRDVALSSLCRIVVGVSRPSPRMKAVRAFTYEEIATLPVGFDHKQIVLDGFAAFRSRYT